MRDAGAMGNTCEMVEVGNMSGTGNTGNIGDAGNVGDRVAMFNTGNGPSI